jgi:hypothetical protein
LADALRKKDSVSSTQPKPVEKNTATRDRSTWLKSIPASRIASDEATSAHADNRSKRRVFTPGTTLAG